MVSETKYNVKLLIKQIKKEFKPKSMNSAKLFFSRKQTSILKRRPRRSGKAMRGHVTDQVRGGLQSPDLAKLNPNSHMNYSNYL